MFAFCDGSIRFFRNRTDPNIVSGWPAEDDGVDRVVELLSRDFWRRTGE